MKRMKKVHILLVEDNEGDIFLTLDAFERSRLETEISVVRNGAEALDFLFLRGDFEKSKRPDLILLDINIPIYNGHEVLKHIKNEPSLKNIPVVVLSTSSSQKDINLAYENHANSYITKPLEVEDFLKAVDEIEGFWLSLTN